MLPVAGAAAARAAAKAGAKLLKARQGGGKKKRRKSIYVVGGVTALAVLSGAAMLFMVMLFSMLGAIGGSSAAYSVIEAQCGINRPAVTAPGGSSQGGLVGVQPGSLVVPMAADSYTLSSPFGMRWGSMHDGQDMAAPIGTPIYAAGDGDVVASGPADGYGLWIRIRHTIDGQPVETLYGHMERIEPNVTVGAPVTAGQMIAVVGNRGQSTGPHLHFGVYPGGWAVGSGVDPMPWLKQEVSAGQAPPETSTPAPTSSTPAPSSDVVTAADWESLAQCESGGNWSANTGNGFYGGLQFTLQTWENHGGTEFAATPDKASKEQQMEVANKVLAEQGWGAWPKCASEKGLTEKKAAPTGTFVDGPANPRGPPPDTSPDTRLAASTPAANCNGGNGVGLAPGSVPPEFVEAVIAAGQVCPEVTSPLVAAQIEQESNWNPNVTSQGDGVNQGGAQGMSQFLPGTWASFGTDSGKDRSGNPEPPNAADPFNPYDAIASQARYDCYIAEVLRPHIASGAVKCPEVIDCILAGYNAGEGAVIQWGGIPPYAQTQAYVPGIKERMTKYTALGSTPSGQAGTAAPITVAGSEFAQAMVTAASQYVGMPYVWGGGDQNGPTVGAGETGETGFDCSGLVLYGVAVASKGQLILPHLTNDQVKMGKEVQVSEIQPGDAIFSNGTGHVAIWLGNGKVLEAQQRGVPVAVHDFDLSNAEDIRRYG